MRTRVLAAFAALLLALGLPLAGATPAQAASGGACWSNSFCLYQWADFGAQVTNDRWQISFNSINSRTNRCVNIRPAEWANGTPVWDNSMSMAWYGSTAWKDWSIAYFNSGNCSGATGWGETGYLSGGGNLSDLRNWVYPSQPSISLYHTIASIQINYKP